jgi:uncharacterized membrane protein
MISLFCAAGVIVGVVIGVLFLSSALVGRDSLKNRFRSLADADRWGQSIWRQGDATTRAEVEIAGATILRYEVGRLALFGARR